MDQSNTTPGEGGNSGAPPGPKENPSAGGRGNHPGAPVPPSVPAGRGGNPFGFPPTTGGSIWGPPGPPITPAGYGGSTWAPPFGGRGTLPPFPLPGWMAGAPSIPPAIPGKSTQGYFPTPGAGVAGIWGAPAPPASGGSIWGPPGPTAGGASPWGAPAPASSGANIWGAPVPATPGANIWGPIAPPSGTGGGPAGSAIGGGLGPFGAPIVGGQGAAPKIPVSLAPGGSGGGILGPHSQPGAGTPWGTLASSSTGGIWGPSAPGGGANSWRNRWNQPVHSTQRMDAEAVTEELKRSFSLHPRFECQNFLGGVHNGTAMVIKEKIPAGSGQDKVRRFVIKAATPDSYPSINNEIFWINRLRWAKHIVKPVAIPDIPLTNIKVPYIVLEYLEHGTLRQFQEKIRKAGQILPNRLLWSLLLSLIRFCFGLAWPPDGPDVQLETTRPDEPTRLAHNDMHVENILFGEIQDTSKDDATSTSNYPMMPIMKLIDFGEAVEFPAGDDPTPLNDFFLNQHDRALNLEAYRPASDRRNQGIDKNILDVGLTMGRIIGRREFGFPVDVRKWMRDPNIHPSLDPDLRLLIQRCIAIDPLNRPRLDEFMILINDGIFNKTADSYGEAGQPGGLESDETFRHIVSTYILNADIG